MTNYFFIDVDVSLQSNQICVLNFDQHRFFNLKFPNIPDDCEDAINKIKQVHDKFFFNKIIDIDFIRIIKSKKHNTLNNNPMRFDIV